MAFLNKKVGPIKLWWLFTFGGLALICVIIGSFVDLNISKGLAYENSTFAKIIESFGTILGCSVAPVSAALITKRLFTKDTKKLYWALGILFVIAMIMLPAYFGGEYASGQSGYSWKYSLWIGVLWLAVLYTAIYFISLFVIDDSVSTKLLVRNGLYMCIGFLIVEIVINLVLKGLIYRPRYRALYWYNTISDTAPLGESFYQNWWSFSFWKTPEWFNQMNVPKDYIKSWPSGHTATSACSLLFPFFTSVIKKRNNLTNVIVYALACLQTVVVAIGRMRAGAHFLSDVSSAVLISLLLMFLPCLLINYVLKKIYKEDVSQILD